MILQTTVMVHLTYCEDWLSLKPGYAVEDCLLEGYTIEYSDWCHANRQSGKEVSKRSAARYPVDHRLSLCSVSVGGHHWAGQLLAI